MSRYPPIPSYPSANFRPQTRPPHHGYGPRPRAPGYAGNRPTYDQTRGRGSYSWRPRHTPPPERLEPYPAVVADPTYVDNESTEHEVEESYTDQTEQSEVDPNVAESYHDQTEQSDDYQAYEEEANYYLEAEQGEDYKDNSYYGEQMVDYKESKDSLQRDGASASASANLSLKKDKKSGQFGDIGAGQLGNKTESTTGQFGQKINQNPKKKPETTTKTDSKNTGQFSKTSMAGRLQKLSNEVVPAGAKVPEVVSEPLVIEGEDDIDSSDDDTDFCKYCKVAFTSLKAYHSHTRGMQHATLVMQAKAEKGNKHYQKEIVSADVLKVVIPEPIAAPEPPAPDQEDNLEENWMNLDDEVINYLRSRKDVSSRDLAPDDIGKKSYNDDFSCPICECKCTGAASFQSHINGKQHKNNLFMAENGVGLKKKKPSGPAVMVTANKDKVSKFSVMAESVEQPLLGVEFVTEFQKPDYKQAPRYVCNLCESKCDGATIIPHIIGMKHRLNYFKEQNPLMYEHLSRYNSKKKKSETNANCEDFALQIEQQQGRKDVKIKIELEPGETEEDLDEIMKRERIALQAKAADLREKNEKMERQGTDQTEPMIKKPRYDSASEPGQYGRGRGRGGYQDDAPYGRGRGGYPDDIPRMRGRGRGQTGLSIYEQKMAAARARGEPVPRPRVEPSPREDYRGRGERPFRDERGERPFRDERGEWPFRDERGERPLRDERGERPLRDDYRGRGAVSDSEDFRVSYAERFDPYRNDPGYERSMRDERSRLDDLYTMSGHRLSDPMLEKRRIDDIMARRSYLDTLEKRRIDDILDRRRRLQEDDVDFQRLQRFQAAASRPPVTREPREMPRDESARPSMEELIAKRRGNTEYASMSHSRPRVDDTSDTSVTAPTDDIALRKAEAAKLLTEEASKNPNVNVGELLSNLSSSMIASENDAAMALQISNALTQALLKYRLQNAPKELSSIAQSIQPVFEKAPEPSIPGLGTSTTSSSSSVPSFLKSSNNSSYGNPYANTSSYDYSAPAPNTQQLKPVPQMVPSPNETKKDKKQTLIDTSNIDQPQRVLLESIRLQTEMLKQKITGTSGGSSSMTNTGPQQGQSQGVPNRMMSHKNVQSHSNSNPSQVTPTSGQMTSSANPVSSAYINNWYQSNYGMTAPNAAPYTQSGGGATGGQPPLPVQPPPPPPQQQPPLPRKK